MILTLAFRNLFHDRIRLAVTLIGILFSIVLVAVQLGLYLGSSRMITGMIEKSNSDLWITAYGAKSFEEGGTLLTERERHQALAVPGVKNVIPLVVAFNEWRKPTGGSTRVVVVGTDAEDGGLVPFDLVAWQLGRYQSSGSDFGRRHLLQAISVSTDLAIPHRSAPAACASAP